MIQNLLIYSSARSSVGADVIKRIFTSKLDLEAWLSIAFIIS